MRWALLADIHSNALALQACLAHAQRQGVDRFAYLGDLTGYGPEPAAVVSQAREHARQGAIVVLGNHDAAVLGRNPHRMSESAQAAIEWSRTQLSAEDLAFLDALPMTVRDGEVLFTHASAHKPERWGYVSGTSEATASMQASDAWLTVGGHVHEPRLYHRREDAQAQSFHPVPGVPVTLHRQFQWLAIAGSMGQPRDGNTAACYALLDLARRRLTFFRVAYDAAGTARRIREVGLPERLASRIEEAS